MIITKKPERSSDDINDALRQFIKDTEECPQDQLPSYLKSHMEWDGAKGNLINWVAVLNRFDSILESVTAKHGFSEKHCKPALLSDEDVLLVVSIVDFTGLLLKHCTNKSLYGSTHRLYDLLATPSTEVIISILKVFIILGKKFSVKTTRRAFVATRQVTDRLYPMALLIPSSTLTSNIDSNDDHTLIDFISGQKRFTPKKWKSLEMAYYPELTSNSTKAPSHIKTSKNTAGETEDLKSAPTQSNSTEAPISTDSPSTVLTGNTTPKEAAPTKDIIRAHKLVIS
ncbi:hypothetical protein WICPIJ_009091, partial [Wickerhamomyces pijperi]